MNVVAERSHVLPGKQEMDFKLQISGVFTIESGVIVGNLAQSAVDMLQYG